MIKVVIIEPGKVPYAKEIDNTLETQQEIVGGFIEMIWLTANRDRNIVLICNEEGKIMQLPGNRKLGDDIIAGTFFVAAHDMNSDDIGSLTEVEIAAVMARFAEPEEYTVDEVEKAIRFEFYAAGDDEE